MKVVAQESLILGPELVPRGVDNITVHGPDAIKFFFETI